MKISCVVMNGKILVNIRSKHESSRPKGPKNRQFRGYFGPKMHEIVEKYHLIAFTVAVSSFFRHTPTASNTIYTNIMQPKTE